MSKPFAERHSSIILAWMLSWLPVCHLQQTSYAVSMQCKEFPNSIDRETYWVLQRARRFAKERNCKE